MTVESQIEQDAGNWNRRLTEDLFRGPSATFPISRLCSEAYRRGLFGEDGKFPFIGEVATLMDILYPQGSTLETSRQVDQAEIVVATGFNPNRVAELLEVMASINFVQTETNQRFR